MRRLGILIVTYNSEGVISGSLASAVRQDAEILVIDNASDDGTVQEARRCQGASVIANAENRGFAAAVNQGIENLDCEFVLLLNPDAVIENGLEDLVAACSQPRTAAAAGKLLDSEGEPQTGFSVRRFPTPAALMFEVLGWNRIWPGNPVNRRFRCLDLDLEEAAEVEQPAGAFLMLRRDVWRQLGGFDEDFFPLWFEEVDYLRRACQQGFRVKYMPSAVARHFGGHSIRKLSPGCRELFWYGSLLKYASKHFTTVSQKLVCAGVVAGLLLRMMIHALSRSGPGALARYGEALRVAVVFLFSGRLPGVARFAAVGTTG